MRVCSSRCLHRIHARAYIIHTSYIHPYMHPTYIHRRVREGASWQRGGGQTFQAQRGLGIFKLILVLRISVRVKQAVTGRSALATPGLLGLGYSEDEGESSGRGLGVKIRVGVHTLPWAIQLSLQRSSLRCSHHLRSTGLAMLR